MNAVFELLAEEGYRPNTDDDGDIQFKSEGWSCLVIGDEDPLYVQVALPNFWPIESEEEREAAISAAVEATRSTKAAKVYPVNDDMWSSVELFLPEPEHLRVVLDSVLGALVHACETFKSKMQDSASDNELVRQFGKILYASSSDLYESLLKCLGDPEPFHRDHASAVGHSDDPQDLDFTPWATLWTHAIVNRHAVQVGATEPPDGIVARLREIRAGWRCTAALDAALSSAPPDCDAPQFLALLAKQLSRKNYVLADCGGDGIHTLALLPTADCDRLSSLASRLADDAARLRLFTEDG